MGPEEAIIGDETVRIPSDEADDAVSQILKKYLAETSDLMRLLSDTSRTGVILVRNPDRLSGIESRHALADLGRLEIPLAMIVWNKVAGTEAAPSPGASPEEEAFPAEESGYTVRRLPLVAEEPSGPDALRELSTLLLSD